MVKYFKLIKLSLVSVIVLLLFNMHSYAVDLYVSTKGNDKNPGTKDKPFATIKRAQKEVRKIKGTVTVYVRSGVYYLTEPIVFSTEDSRNPKEKVVYKAYPGEQVRISGGISLQLKWETYKDNIKKAKLPIDLTIDQLFVNGTLQQMARYPNYDTTARFYNGFAADALSRERIKTWSNPKGGYIHSLHKHEWGGFHSVILGKDAKGELITEGGWQNNRQMGMHDKIKFVENIFEELDAPGEWFYNQLEKILYFYPPKGYNPDNALIEVPRLKSLFEFKGTERIPVTCISIEGFEIAQTLRTFMETREPLLRSDWAIYRGGAIVFEGTQNCSIKNCFINTVGGNAIFFNNYNRNSEVSGCQIANAGASGVCFVGDPSAVRSPSFEYNQFVPYEKLDLTAGPKSNNYPADCKAYNNLIYKIGRIEKQAAGVQISMAMDITVSHNTIYDTPRAGINIGDGCWGGHLLEFNDVFNTVLETGDHGAFNSWGRDRFWRPERPTIDSIVAARPGIELLDVIDPIIIRNNRFQCDHGWDIDLDDGSGNYQVYNNVCLSGGLKLREGYHRTVTNNILVNNTFHPHVWLKNSGDVFAHNIVTTPYAPILMNSWGKEIDSNFFLFKDGLTKAQALNLDKNSLWGDAMFVDAEKGDYRIKQGSPALNSGFKNFNMDFGVTRSAFKKIAAKPPIKPLLTKVGEVKGSQIEWLGAKFKNIETLGERSAAGMPDNNGALLVELPANSIIAKNNLQKGDVIIKIGDENINSISDLLKVYQSTKWMGRGMCTIIRSQAEQKINISFNKE